MTALVHIADKVRSKNAGPFWLTIDIFCGSAPHYEHIVQHVTTAEVARLLATDVSEIKRFEVPDLHVLKFSLPRPTVQGARNDRDMHGAQWSNLLEELDIPAC
ncbi:MAG: DUF4387 family protein [Pseudomonadota bacterium]